MSLNHLHIKATNLKETRQFYEKYFDFVEAFDCGHKDAAFLVDAGGFLLAIFEYAHGEPKFTFPDWFHFGFCRARESDVHEIYSKMRADKVSFARALKVFDDGTVNFYCYDPAGHKVEVSWNPEESKLFSPPKRELAHAGR